VVVLAGGVATWVSVSCLGTVTGRVGAPLGLGVACVAFVPYVLALAFHRRGFRSLPMPERWSAWLIGAIEEEESELGAPLDTRRGGPRDAVVALGALLIVVVASVVMERSATSVGATFSVPGVVIGGVVLAAVTSLPNAVAAIYLSSRGRGSATLSTALNSNSLNVLIGLLIPAVVIGLSSHSDPTSLAAWWYVGLTTVAVTLAFVQRGLRRSAGWLLVLGYVGYVVSLIVVA
jgi:cation:H+ antiporter